MTAASVDPDFVDEAAAPGPAKRPGFVYFLGYGIMAPIARLVFRPHITGRENIPDSFPSRGKKQ